MMKILTVIGARPQIIKASAISRAIRNYYSDQVVEKILHTGQHYDTNMSQVFFEELNIPLPDYNLNVGSGNHGVQTAKMMIGIEEVIRNEHFDGMIIYGDTNSTLAGAVIASKLHLPIFHIEAGLRSFNMSMPEEVNRIVCDQLSSMLFAPTQTAVDNLIEEGFNNNNVKFKDGKKRIVLNSGDIMYDNSLYFAQLSNSKEHFFKALGIEKENYVLATIHRDNNTDNEERLTSIFKALIQISKEDNMKIVCPLHPRTATKLQQIKGLIDTLNESKDFLTIPPVSFLEMITLEKNSKLIMTDSGGVQKEAYFFKKPCVILRSETEWVEIVKQGTGILTDANQEMIVDSYRLFMDRKLKYPPLFGNGCAAELIIKQIINYN